MHCLQGKAETTYAEIIAFKKSWLDTYEKIISTADGLCFVG
jgi:hypothetical protein